MATKAIYFHDHAGRKIMEPLGLDGYVEIAYEGDFIHPVTGENFTLSKEQFQSWVSYFHKLKSLGNTIPLADADHSVSATKRLGTVEDLKIVKLPGRKGLSVVMKASLEEGVRVSPRTSYSVMFEDNVILSNGDRYPSILAHVAVTDYPVLLGMNNSIALSIPASAIQKSRNGDTGSSGKGTQTINRKELTMAFDYKKLATILGLDDTATEEQVLETLQSKMDELTDLQAKIAELEEANKLETTNSVKDDEKPQAAVPDAAVKAVAASRMVALSALNLSEKSPTYKKLSAMCQEKHVRSFIESGSDIDPFALIVDALSTAESSNNSKYYQFRSGRQDLSTTLRDPNKLSAAADGSNSGASEEDSLAVRLAKAKVARKAK